MMKNRLFALLLASLGLLLTAPLQAADSTPKEPKLPAPNFSQQSQALDGIAAIVNKDIITLSELNKKYDFFSSKLKASGATLPPPEQLRLQVLNNLINRKVELQTAERSGIQVDDHTVEQAMSEILKRDDKNLATLIKELSDQGISLAEFKKDLREQLMIDRLQQREISSRIVITKEEVDKFLHSVPFESNNIAQYRLGDILIALPEVPNPQQIQKAQQTADHVIKSLNEGKDFEQLALAYSNNEAALRGGDLGWRRIEEIPSIFAEKVNKMESGDVEGPIRTANGFHIIKLLDTQGSAAKHYRTDTHVRHILIKANTTDDDPEIILRLQAMREEIEKGGDFAEFAKKNSQDLPTASKGGDLGWVPPGQLVPPFEKAMNDLTIGLVSEPVRTLYGWHLIQVLGRKKTEDTQTYQRDKIRNLLYTRQFREEAQNWVQRMRDYSFVKIMIPTEQTPQHASS